MSNTPHTLGDEFPDQLEKIHALKAKDAHFARILEEYDEVNDQIHRAESRIDTISDEDEAILRKRRLALKDTIAAALAKED
ncbi:YdcH family protein [Xanthobacter sp. TB0136]|uniref:YdcH family protein n=1 Tax=Xanthobacter sp. TB0136 TaxID=3459177 RepID=UPI004039B9A7